MGTTASCCGSGTNRRSPRCGAWTRASCSSCPATPPPRRWREAPPRRRLPRSAGRPGRAVRAGRAVGDAQLPGGRVAPRGVRGEGRGVSAVAAVVPSLYASPPYALRLFPPRLPDTGGGRLNCRARSPPRTAPHASPRRHHRDRGRHARGEHRGGHLGQRPRREERRGADHALRRVEFPHHLRRGSQGLRPRGPAAGPRLLGAARPETAGTPWGPPLQGRGAERAAGRAGETPAGPGAVRRVPRRRRGAAELPAVHADGRREQPRRGTRSRHVRQARVGAAGRGDRAGAGTETCPRRTSRRCSTPAGRT